MATMGSAELDVLIIGAGIGGLTLAQALTQRGKTVRVLESALALENVGAGIQIPPNAVKVLRALGLEGPVTAYAFQPRAIEARMGRSGRPVFDISLVDEAEKRWGAPYLHIHRADYISALSKDLPEGTIQLNARVKSYANTANDVSVTLLDGCKFTAQYLIGADGIRSVVRTQMLGSDVPQFTGNMAWRATVPAERLGDLVPNPTACAWFGPNRHAVTYRLGAQGQLVNFVGVVEQESWQEEGWSLQGERAEALNDFAGWHPVIRNLLENADELHRWALFDRAPLEKCRRPRGSNGRRSSSDATFFSARRGYGCRRCVGLSRGDCVWTGFIDLSETARVSYLQSSSGVAGKYGSVSQSLAAVSTPDLWSDVGGRKAYTCARASPHELALWI